MSKITKEQYEFALERVEELLPLVDDNTPVNDKKAVELTMMSDIVIAYEKEHYPIEKPTVAELIELSLEEKGMTQKELKKATKLKTEKELFLGLGWLLREDKIEEKEDEAGELTFVLK